MAREQLAEWVNGPKRTLERAGVFHSSGVASDSKRYKIPWNRREARDETLDNRGNFGSRVVLKRDCAYFEEGNHARPRTVTMYFSWYRIGQVGPYAFQVCIYRYKYIRRRRQG
jgi:hypothetical protein